MGIRKIASAVAALGLSFAGVATADSTVVVTPSSMSGWTFYSTDFSGTPNTGSNTGEIVTSPPPTQVLNSGSAHLVAASDGGSEQLRTHAFAGTSLNSITAMTA
jgi:hypothetical protein